MNNKNMLLLPGFAIVLLLAGFASGIDSFSGSFGSFSSLNYQSQPNFQTYYGAGQLSQYWPILAEEKQCQGRQDFVLQVAPAGCEPMVVSSDLLAEQNVPVFCQINALQINPLINVKEIKNIHFSGKYPDSVAATGFHPARAALATGDVLVGSPFGNKLTNNIGYAVIILKRNPIEKNLSDSVTVNLTGELEYESGNAFGIGRTEFLLPRLTDEQWDSEKANYGFWQGRYFLRLEDADANSASVSLFYGDKKVGSVTANAAGTQSVFGSSTPISSKTIYLPGMYCQAGVEVQYNGFESSTTMARIQVTTDSGTDSYRVTEGSTFDNGKCTVNRITIDPKAQGAGSLRVTCYGAGSVDLKISPRQNVIGKFVTDKGVFIVPKQYPSGSLEPKYYILDFTGKDSSGNEIRPAGGLKSGVYGIDADGNFYYLADKREDIGKDEPLVIRNSNGAVTDAFKSDASKEKIYQDMHDGLLNYAKILSGAQAGATQAVFDSPLPDATAEKEFNDAIAAYKMVAEKHKYEKRTEVEGGDYYGEAALVQAMGLITQKNGVAVYKPETQMNLLRQLMADYPDSVSINEYKSQIASVATQDGSAASAVLKIDNKYKTIRLDSIEKPLNQPSATFKVGNFNNIEINQEETKNGDGSVGTTGSSSTTKRFSSTPSLIVEHNLNDLAPRIIVYDSSNNVIFDSSSSQQANLNKITISDMTENKFVLNFGTPVAGKVEVRSSKNSGLAITSIHVDKVTGPEEAQITVYCRRIRSGAEVIEKVASGARISVSDPAKDYCASEFVKLDSVSMAQVAKVVLVPKASGTGTLTNVTVTIGIEKRAIQLSPERTKQMIKNLNETILKWEAMSKKLASVVTALKATCFATSAILIAKNFITGLDGTTTARQQAMEGPNGWNAKCKKEVEAGDSKSMNLCFIKHKAEIDSEITTRRDTINEVNDLINNQIETTDSGILKEGGMFDQDSVDTQKAAEELKAQIISEYKTKRPDVVAMLEKGGPDSKGRTSYTYSELRDLYFNLKLQDRDPSIGSTTSDLTTITKNIEDRQKMYSEIRASESAGGLIKYGVAQSQALPTQSSQTQFFTIKDGKVGGMNTILQSGPPLNDGDRAAIYDAGGGQFYLFVGTEDLTGRLNPTTVYHYTEDRTNGQVTLSQVKDKTAEQNVVNAGDLLQKGKIAYLENSDKSTRYKTEMDESVRKARFFGPGPFEGLAALVPFDSPPSKGWYVKVEPNVGALGQQAAYDKSALPKKWKICNVMSNGLIDSEPNDDCQIVEEGRTTGVEVLGQGTNSQKLIENSRQALLSASGQSGRSTVQIGKSKPMQVDKNPVALTDPTQCENFMSISDCRILFNVCDPVICPNSRCDLGGTYKVDDVIKTGIIGGTLLCLPNAREPIFIPFCLTGIQAGMDGWISILKNHRDCLQNNLDTGQMVGICDEIYSVYKCKFFWEQVAPFVNAIIPKLIGAAYGQTGARGGGEYKNVQSAWSNVQSSVNFFTQSYAANSFKAFQTKSITEIGFEFCQGSISAVLPKGFKSLVEPESPPQYHAWFDATPYSTVTVPATSQYKVFYHIYAGKSAGVTYSVFLKSPPDSSYYSSTPRVQVATGFIAAGQYASETKDFTAPEGYKELCIMVNAEEHCGFKSVTTSFALDYASGMYAKDELTKQDIKTEQECTSGSPSLGAGIINNLNPQSALTEAAMPNNYDRGIVRVCASKDPGSSTEPGRYKNVGICGANTGMTCWLDTKSVNNAISDANVGLKKQTMQDLQNNQQALLEKEGYYAMGEAEARLNELEKEAAKVVDETTFNAFLLKSNDVASRLVLNPHKARLLYINGNAFGNLFINHIKTAPLSTPALTTTDVSGDYPRMFDVFHDGQTYSFELNTTTPTKGYYQVRNESYDVVLVVEVSKSTNAKKPYTVGNLYQYSESNPPYYLGGQLNWEQSSPGFKAEVDAVLLAEAPSAVEKTVVFTLTNDYDAANTAKNVINLNGKSSEVYVTYDAKSRSGLVKISGIIFSSTVGKTALSNNNFLGMGEYKITIPVANEKKIDDAFGGTGYYAELNGLCLKDGLKEIGECTPIYEAPVEPIETPITQTYNLKPVSGINLPGVASTVQVYQVYDSSGNSRTLYFAGNAFYALSPTSYAVEEGQLVEFDEVGSKAPDGTISIYTQITGLLMDTELAGFIDSLDGKNFNNLFSIAGAALPSSGTPGTAPVPATTTIYPTQMPQNINYPKITLDLPPTPAQAEQYFGTPLIQILPGGYKSLQASTSELYVLAVVYADKLTVTKTSDGGYSYSGQASLAVLGDNANNYLLAVMKNADSDNNLLITPWEIANYRNILFAQKTSGAAAPVSSTGLTLTPNYINCEVGKACTKSISITGGKSPYLYGLSDAGTMPFNLECSGDICKISWTPSSVTYYDVEVRDSSSPQKSAKFRVNVVAVSTAPTPTSTPAPTSTQVLSSKAQKALTFLAGTKYVFELDFSGNSPIYYYFTGSIWKWGIDEEDGPWEDISIKPGDNYGGAVAYDFAQSNLKGTFLDGVKALINRARISVNNKLLSGRLSYFYQFNVWNFNIEDGGGLGVHAYFVYNSNGEWAIPGEGNTDSEGFVPISSISLPVNPKTPKDKIVYLLKKNGWEKNYDAGIIAFLLASYQPSGNSATHNTQLLNFAYPSDLPPVLSFGESQYSAGSTNNVWIDDYPANADGSDSNWYIEDNHLHSRRGLPDPLCGRVDENSKITTYDKDPSSAFGYYYNCAELSYYTLSYDDINGKKVNFLSLLNGAKIDSAAGIIYPASS